MTRLPHRFPQRLLLPVLPALSCLLFATCEKDIPTDASRGSIDLAAKPSGGDPIVSSTDPTSAPQDTTLNVEVSGSNFDQGSRVDLAIDEVTTDKVRTNSTTFVNTKKLIANITIAPDAIPDRYDVIVTISKGKRGIGIETGVGEAWSSGFARGEDYATLATALLYSGAGSVVATLWRIDDRGAAELATRFYRHLRDRSPAEALALAQRELIRSEAYRRPYYWAGYRISGGEVSSASRSVRAEPEAQNLLVSAFHGSGRQGRDRWVLGQGIGYDINERGDVAGLDGVGAEHVAVWLAPQ